MVEKPAGESAGWRRLRTEYPFSCRVFRLRRDHLLVNGSHEFEFAYLETKGAVWVVPVTPEGNIVLIRQYRYAIDEWIWEVPAGGLFDHDGDLESLVRKELVEEIGGHAGRIDYLGWFYGSAATANSQCHVFIAHDTCLKFTPQPEPTECIELHEVPVAEALRMARAGEIREGRSALALLWAEPHLKADAVVKENR